MAQFPLEIVTPDGLIFEGDADAILVRTADGEIEILRGHTDYFAPLGIGRARLTVGGVSRNASAAGGFISVKDGVVKLVATTFEFADEIDVERAQRAKERAEETLSRSSDGRAIDLAKLKLARAINRINVAELK